MKFFIIIALAILITITDGFSATLLKKSSEWPYTSVAPYLQPEPNSLVAGRHNDYPANGVVVWAIGDTVSILNADDLSEIRTFRVSTKTIINDFFYKDDAGVETLYVAAGNGGLQIFDLADLSVATIATPVVSYTESPDNPGFFKVSETTIEKKTAINAQGLGYYNGHVFLADRYFGLRVIDVSDVSDLFEVPLAEPDTDNKRISGYIQPNIYGSLDTTGGYTNAEVFRYNEKTYAFVLDYYYGLRVFDVTNPAIINPPVSKSMKTNFLYGTLALVTDIFVATGADSRLYAYVTAVDIYGNDSVVARLDVLSDIGNLEEKSIINIGRCITPGASSGVFVKDELAFVADGDSGLQIVDLTNGVPNKDEVLDYSIHGSFEANVKGARSVYGNGNKIYMTSSLNGLQEIDITTTSLPSIVTTLNSPISGDSVYLTENYAYLLDGEKGLRIFGVAEPSSFYLKSYFENTGPAYDIYVLNSHAYIANGSDGILIVDVTNPELPVLAGSQDTVGISLAVDLYQANDKKYLCVADGAGGFTIIDVSDPAKPEDPVNVFSPGETKDLCVFGNYAYLADGTNGLKIVDLKEFFLVGAKDTNGDAMAVAAFAVNSSVYALIADDISGIMIENVTEPQNIPDTVNIIASPSVDSNFISLEIIENYLFASAGLKGIFVYDISEPLLPVLVCAYESKGFAKAVAPYKKENTFYFASAEDNNGIVHYKMAFDSDDEPIIKMNNSADTSCFILSLLP